jgi:molybdopterin-guanine dinucleotide biosynthesis protein A
MNKCALVLTDGNEAKTLPSRFGAKSESTLLEYVLDSVWTVADEIFVIFGEEPSLTTVEKVAPFGVKAVIDRNGSSAFSMIMAGFRASNSENCLVVESAAPFVKPSLLFHLYESVVGFDAAIPRWKDGKTEPLLSAYSRRAFVRAATGLKRRTLPSLVDSLYDVCYVDIENLLMPKDPDLHSFFRVRRDSDLRQARVIASSRVRQFAQRQAQQGWHGNATGQSLSSGHTLERAAVGGMPWALSN